MLLYRFDSKHRCYCMPYNCPFLKKGGRFHRQSVSIFAWGGEPWSFSSPRLRLRATWSHHHPKVTSRIASCFLDCLRAFFPTLFFVILSSGIYTIIYSCKYIRWCPQQKSPIYFTTTNLFPKKNCSPGILKENQGWTPKNPLSTSPTTIFFHIFFLRQTNAISQKSERSTSHSLEIFLLGTPDQAFGAHHGQHLSGFWIEVFLHRLETWKKLLWKTSTKSQQNGGGCQISWRNEVNRCTRNQLDMRKNFHVWSVLWFFP